MTGSAPKILEGEKAILDRLAALGVKRGASWLRKWRREGRAPVLPVVTMAGSNRLMAYPEALERFVAELLAGGDGASTR